MPTDRPPAERSRHRLTRERVLRTAIAHADAHGLEGLSMRTLAEALDVAPMALYRHVTDKDDLITAMVDAVFTEIGVPAGAGDWKTAMWRRAISVRDALSRHPWAIGVMESRRDPGPANIRHHDAVIGRLRAAGFSVGMTAHVYSLLDSYIYGFALTTRGLPFQATRGTAAIEPGTVQPFGVNEYPNLVEFIVEHAAKPTLDLQEEFEYGLRVILDGIDRALGTA
jgi:AcrR family transcriptional regulator